MISLKVNLNRRVQPKLYSIPKNLNNRRNLMTGKMSLIINMKWIRTFKMLKPFSKDNRVFKNYGELTTWIMIRRRNSFCRSSTRISKWNSKLRNCSTNWATMDKLQFSLSSTCGSSCLMSKRKNMIFWWINVWTN